MPVTIYQEVLSQVERLSADDQLRLMEKVAGILRRQMSGDRVRSITELKGLGRDIWRDIDVREYIDRERDFLEWLTDLHGRIVGLDTAPLIYYIEENVNYASLVQPFFEAMDRGEFLAVTSTVMLLEVLVQPLRRGDQTLAEQYRDILLHARGLFTKPMNREIAEEAAQLRALYGIRTADAIQVATALSEGASFFVTNDARLAIIREIKVLRLRDKLPDTY